MAGVRHKLGLAALSKLKQAKGKRVALPELDSVNHIGIVYQRGLQQDNTAVSEFVQTLRSAGKQVVELIFVNTKKLPEDLSNELHRIYITKKDLDWKSLPRKSAVIAFTREEFDCLLNLDMSDTLPLQAVSAMSKAKLRVGAYSKNFQFCHDLMIESGSADPQKMVQQIKHYLSFKI